MMYKGKEVWDNTDEVLFFEAIMAKIVARLPQQQNESASATSAPAGNGMGKVTGDDIPAYHSGQQSGDSSGNNPNEDLPF